jgi:hypothetical protein
MLFDIVLTGHGKHTVKSRGPGPEKAAGWRCDVTPPAIGAEARDYNM